MATLIPYFQQQHREYIFPVIDAKLADLKSRQADVQILNFGVGDVCLPLVPAIRQAIIRAVEEMGEEGKMRGYGPSNGYLFLREAIAQHEFSSVNISPDEIFISEGAGGDTANIQELFSASSTVGILDPTYPAYLDSVLMAGKARVVPIPCTEENGFCPAPPDVHCDFIYLCSPSNPTGVAFTRQQLKAWVDYALKEDALLLLDHAYEAFITSEDVPRTIYEIEGAKECAIEFRSFSKTAGFTGLRCGYTVLPKSVKAWLDGKKVSLNPLWDKRQSVKFNGASYPIQKGAEAVFTPQGQQETKEQINSYLRAARTLKDGLTQLGYTCYGGVDSPYIWWKTPNGMSSWEFFDLLLEKCHLISIPGRGFGSQGEGFVRLSAFTTLDHVNLALERICAMQ
jgi:LL-diaminopimelate aminotransferase